MKNYEDIINRFDEIQDLPVSEEMLGAYMEGNLSEDEKANLSNMIHENPDMEEIIFMSDFIDEDIENYKQDRFLYEADMTALDNTDFEIPDPDAVSPSQPDNSSPEETGISHDSDDTSELPDHDDLSDFNDYPDPNIYHETEDEPIINHPSPDLPDENGGIDYPDSDESIFDDNFLNS